MKFLVVFSLILNISVSSISCVTTPILVDMPTENLAEQMTTGNDFDLNKIIEEIIINNASSMIIKNFFQPYQIISKFNVFSPIKFNDLFVNPKGPSFTNNGVLFYNISYSENENQDVNLKSKFSSSKHEQVNILPLSTSSIKLSANMKIISEVKNLSVGRVTIFLLNPYLSEVYSKKSTGVINDVNIKLEYGETKVDLEIEPTFRRQVLISLEAFFVEIDSHLKIDSTVYVSLILFHLKRNTELQVSQNQDPFWSHKNDLFVIPSIHDAHSELLKIGPIVIEGLTNFTQVDVEADRVENEDTIDININVGVLKGIFIIESDTGKDKGRQYNRFNFTVDCLEVQSTIKIQVGNYVDKSYSIDVYLKAGKVEIDHKSIDYDDERSFINLIDPQYLENVIIKYLMNSIKDFYRAQFPSN